MQATPAQQDPSRGAADSPAGSSILSRRGFRVLGVLLVLLGVGESLRGLQLSQQRVQDADIAAMRAQLGDSPLPVVAHRAWLDPLVRQWLPKAARQGWWSAADRKHWPEFWSIAHRSDPPSPEGSSQEGAGLTLVQSKRYGSLIARRWTNPGAQRSLASLGPDFATKLQISASVQEGPCRITSKDPLQIRCPDQSTLIWERAEIDYQPRHCLAYRSGGLGPLTLSMQFPAHEHPAYLRGHVGFSDFNARLRSDAALGLQIRQNQELWIDHPFTDAQGWAPFQGPRLEPSARTTQIELRLHLNANRARSKTLQRRVIPCIELRWMELQP